MRQYAGMRQLAEVTVGSTNMPSCFWLEAQKACVPSYQNMLAVTGASPNNIFRK